MVTPGTLDPDRFSKLFLLALQPVVHRSGCTGQDRTTPAVQQVGRLLEQLLALKWEYGNALNACEPPPDIRKRRGCPVKCLSCDLEHLEAMFYRLRGSMYDVPDCCITPVRFLREGTPQYLNKLADRWELELPFPAPVPQIRGPASRPHRLHGS